MKNHKIIFLLFSILLYTIMHNSAIYAKNLYVSATNDALTNTVKSASAVMIDAKTGIVLYDKEKDTKKYPASITKIMTALIVLEYAEEYNDSFFEKQIHVTDAVLRTLDPDSSVMGLKAGEVVTVDELLYGLMLPSGNDAAVVLAELVSGNEEAFARKMTKRAHELGAVNSNFINAHGLYDENHYTTPYDMALIMREAIKYEKFIELISSASYMWEPTNMNVYGRQLKNTNKLILEGEYYYPRTVGGKTGYTDESGHTLVSYAKDGDMEFITVVMDAEKNMTFADSIEIYNYGFENLEYREVLNKNSYTANMGIFGEYEGRTTMFGEAALAPAESLSLLMPKDTDSADIVFSPNTSGYIYDHIEKGTPAGTLTIYCDGTALADVELVSLSDINSDTYYNIILDESIRIASQSQQLIPVFATQSEDTGPVASFIGAYFRVLVMLGCLACLLGIYVIVKPVLTSNRRVAR